MVDLVLSRHGVPIRLTDERWSHITEEHCELAGLRSEVLEAIVRPEPYSAWWRWGASGYP